MFNKSYISKQLVKEFHLNEKTCKDEELKRRGGKKMDSPNAEANLEALSKYGRNLVEDVKTVKSIQLSDGMMKSAVSFRSCPVRQKTIRC